MIFTAPCLKSNEGPRSQFIRSHAQLFAEHHLPFAASDLCGRYGRRIAQRMVDQRYSSHEQRFSIHSRARSQPIALGGFGKSKGIGPGLTLCRGSRLAISQTACRVAATSFRPEHQWARRICGSIRARSQFQETGSWEMPGGTLCEVQA